MYFTAFCTPDGHLLVNRYYRLSTNGFGIHVYSLCLDDEAPRLLATFELPRLSWDFSSWLNSTFFPGYGKYSQLDGGIAAGATRFAPATVLVQLRIDLQYTLFTPLATFLAPEVLEHRARSAPLRFAWAAWGPRSTRILHENMESAIVCGYRAVYPTCILEFCPVAAPDDDDSIVRAETVIHAPVFTEPVRTSLPYRKVELPFAETLARDQTQLFFEDRDGPKVCVPRLICTTLYQFMSMQIVRATCKDFILIPTSVDIYALEPDDESE